MAKLKFTYAGDGAIEKLLARHSCPTPFHVVRMRFWGQVVSPSSQVSPAKTIESFWPDRLPAFDNAAEANAFFQTLLGLWNHVARFQSGALPLKLRKLGPINSREGLHAAAKLRVEELYDGFMRGFTGGKQEMDVPPGVGDLLAQVEKGIELLATTRNTFARAPGPDDAAMLAELGGLFPVVDRALHDDLNAIALRFHPIMIRRVLTARFNGWARPARFPSLAGSGIDTFESDFRQAQLLNHLE